MKKKRKQQNNRKPALEEVLKARREGQFTRSTSWGGKGYIRKDNKKINERE